MKKKICFWINKNFVQYGLANKFKNNSDYELYGIVDGNKSLQNFVENQNLINFKKIFNFVNKIEKKPDLAYLKSFEERYEINLVHIAYTDRLFYKEYNKYYSFSHEEILSLLENECRFFESILDEIKPDYVLLGLFNQQYQYLLYQMCQRKSISMIFLEPMRFGDRFLVTDQMFYDPEGTPEKIQIHAEKKSKKEILSFFKEFKPLRFYKQINPTSTYKPKKLDKIKAFSNFLLTSDALDDMYANYGKTKKNILLKGTASVNSVITKRRVSFIDKNFEKKIPENSPFIYFPMHVDPEKVLLMGAPYFTDQIPVIKNIAKSIPVDFKLYVKEHPGMKWVGWRPESYYKDILNIPNVVLVHPSVSSEEIMKKSSLVITIRGTSSLEAAFYEKPSIVFFPEIGYETLSAIHILSDISELPTAIRTSLKKQVNLLDLSDYIRFTEKNSFELSTEKFNFEMSQRLKYNVGYLYDQEISETEMTSLLDDYDWLFSMLYEKYYEKIKQTNNLGNNKN